MTATHSIVNLKQETKTKAFRNKVVASGEATRVAGIEMVAIEMETVKRIRVAAGAGSPQTPHKIETADVVASSLESRSEKARRRRYSQPTPFEKANLRTPFLFTQTAVPRPDQRLRSRDLSPECKVHRSPSASPLTAPR